MKLSDWPSLRLVIPLAGGIILSDTIQDAASLSQYVLPVAVSVLTLTLVPYLYGGRQARLFGVGMLLSFFLTGAWSYGSYSAKVHVSWPEDDNTWWGYVTDWPQEKPRSYRIDVSLGNAEVSGRNVILYVPKDSIAGNLEPGMCVAFQGIIRKPANDGSLDFDYARYLYRHDVSGTLWVSSDRWQPVDNVRSETIGIRSARLRRQMFSKLAEWGLEGNALAVVAAVSLGEKRSLDSSLKQIYSSSGASHVLAVSGLHVGILFWLLGMLLPKQLFPFRFRWIRELVIMAVLWAYAVAIGLPLSITRSLIMFSMLSFCSSVGRDSSSINTLSFAAMVILLIEPQSLFDIGFQLSFSAVLGILLFEPLLHGLVKTRSSAGEYVWGIICVSLAAQIGTAPLVMYSFGTFSTYFLITNLLVIPIMFLVVCLSMMIWAVGWFEMPRILTVKLLTFLTDFENACLERIVSLPDSVINMEFDSPLQVWAVYMVILSVWLWIKEKRSARLVHGLMGLAAVEMLLTVQNFAV